MRWQTGRRERCANENCAACNATFGVAKPQNKSQLEFMTQLFLPLLRGGEVHSEVHEEVYNANDERPNELIEDNDPGDEDEQKTV